MKPDQIKYYPMTLPQQIMLSCMKYSTNKAIIDISSMLTIDSEVDVKLLLQACYLAIQRNESSYVRLHKQNKDIVSYISGETPERIEICDYSERTLEELYADVKKWSRTPFPDSSLDCQLYKVKLIYRPDGKIAMYFCVSHLAFDAYALMALATDMMNIYAALRDEKPIAPYKGNYLKMCEEDWNYQNSAREAADVEFWTKTVFAEEPFFAVADAGKMKRHKGKNFGKGMDLLHSNASQYSRTLPAELCSKVNEAAEKMHVSPQVFYLLAVRAYLSAENDHADDITIMNIVARRATLLHKRSGGTRALGALFRMDMSNDLTVEEALNVLAAKQKKYYPHSDCRSTDITVDYFMKQWKLGPFDSYYSVVVTYNPYMMDLPEGIEAHMESFTNGSTSMPLYLTIMSLDNSGDLNFNYECMDVFTDENTVDRMHRRITSALELMVSDPKASISKL